MVVHEYSCMLCGFQLSDFVVLFNLMCFCRYAVDRLQFSLSMCIA